MIAYPSTYNCNPLNVVSAPPPHQQSKSILHFTNQALQLPYIAFLSKFKRSDTTIILDHSCISRVSTPNTLVTLSTNVIGISPSDTAPLPQNDEQASTHYPTCDFPILNLLQNQQLQHHATVKTQVLALGKILSCKQNNKFYYYSIESFKTRMAHSLKHERSRGIHIHITSTMTVQISDVK